MIILLCLSKAYMDGSNNFGGSRTAQRSGAPDHKTFWARSNA